VTKIWPLPTLQIAPLAEQAEERRVALITSQPAWRAVQNRLRLPVVVQVEVTQATTQHWDELGSHITPLQAQVCYAVGGGLAADAGKYLSARLGLPLVCVPTALTVDAFFTWASGVRQDGCVVYLETQIPGLVLVDFDVLCAAPPHLRAAGITDVLSIATGVWDWKLAEDRQRNPPNMAYLPWAAVLAKDILESALDCAAAAGRGDPAGLKQLLDCLCLEVQLCNLIGHARPEEGSEHYFAYALENLAGKGLPHGDLVGPGILHMAQRQGQDTTRLEAALRACQVPLDHVQPGMIAETLRILPDYVRNHALPYGIAHDLMPEIGVSQ
jgi:glycerol-1-phosphate dehydrogenase [NAD(P)+]